MGYSPEGVNRGAGESTHEMTDLPVITRDAPVRAQAGAVAAAALAALRQALRRIEPVTAGAMLLALFYTAGYLGHQVLPGNDPAYPLGWWGWWDQSQYIGSARALAAQDWTPSSHWYPLGYAILAAPFVHLQRAHLFFFVDLACLIACYGGFLAFARRVGVGAPWAVPAFVLAVAGDPRLFQTWIEPWNTSPTAALFWLLLASIAGHFDTFTASRLRLGTIGLLAAAIPLFRPTDGLAAAVCVAGVLLHDGLGRRLSGRNLVAMALGGALVMLPYAALYLRIYGLHQTEYVRISRQLGFVPGDFVFKAFVLLIEPRAWFGMGEGVLERAPWIVLGLAGIVSALTASRPPARWALALLVVAMAAQAFLYIAYIDLLPSGLWLYHAVHYFKWMVPGFALLAVLWVRQLIMGRRLVAVLALVGLLVILSVRIVPERETNGGQSRLAYFPGLIVSWPDGYLAPALALQDAAGSLPNITAMRLVPLPDGLRAVALRRKFEPPIAWAAGAAPTGAQQAAAPYFYYEHVTIGWPCILPPYPCKRTPF